MKIQPVQSWQNGQAKEATEFDLRIINDNLSTSATFYYSLSSVEVSHTETKVVTPEIPAWDEPVIDGETIHHEAIPAVTEDVKVIDSNPQVLIEGNTGIDGADYKEWDLAVNANAYAYDYVATKLNLVLIADQKF